MRANLEDNRAQSLRLSGTKYGVLESRLSGPLTVNPRGPQNLYLDPQGVSRQVFLPPITPGGGQQYIIKNTGSSGNLLISDSGGVLLQSALPSSVYLLVSSFSAWSVVPLFSAIVTASREVLTAPRSYFVRVNLGTCSISVASPGVITKTSHGLQANDPIVLSLIPDPATITVTIASPAVVTWNAHGFAVNQPVAFETTAALPTGMTTEGAATISIASPAVVTRTGHGLVVGQQFQFTTVGVLPTGASINTPYFVIAAGFGANSFQFSTTSGGAAVNTSGTQAGNHTILPIYFVIATGLAANTFQFSATLGGSAVNTSGTQTGPHRGYKTGNLPTGATPGTIYYVVGAGLTPNTFNFSATPGGAAINTTGFTTGIPSIATGNDLNNGLAATRSGAYLTPQKAWETVSQGLDLNAKAVTIKLADSVYTSSVVMSNGTVGVSSFNVLAFEGNLTSPKNVSFNCASGNGCFEVGLGGVGFPITAVIRGMELKNSVNAGIQVWGGSTNIFLQNVEFGPCAGAQVASQHQGQVSIMGTTYAVTGGATYGLAAISGGQIYTDGGTTLTYWNSPAYTYNFYAQGSGSNIYCGGMTFVGGGNVTGFRFVSDKNATIDPAGAGITYIPGSVAGAMAGQGIYDSLPLPIADGGTNAITVAAAQANFGYSAIIGGFANNVNFNAVGDTQITITAPTGNYRINSITIVNQGATAALNVAQYGLFSAAGGGGTALVAGGTAMNSITSNTVNTAVNHLVNATVTATWNLSSVFFRITTAQGAAASGSVYIIIQPLP